MRGPDGEAPRPRVRDDRVPDGHEPERRPEPGVDQAEAGRARRRLLRHGRHRPGLEDRAHADRRRRARRAVRLGDDGQHEHRLVRGLHGHLRVARDVHRRQRRAPRRRARPRAHPRHRLEGARDRRERPRDRERRGDREGRAAEDDQRRRRGRRGDLQLRRADQRLVDRAEAVRRRRRRDGAGRDRPALGDLLRRVRRGRGGRRRDGRGRRAEDGAGVRRRPRDQPDARRGADRGRGDHGARPRPDRGELPALPLARAPRRRVRRLSRAGDARTCPSSTT